jgi:Ribonuclease G/E
MSNRALIANVNPVSGTQPWDAPDPLPVMRRELKRLRIEMSVLRIEVEQLRAMNQEARKTEEFLSASANRWRREAEHLRALIEQVPPWSLMWQRCVDALKAWRSPIDQGCHSA